MRKLSACLVLIILVLGMMGISRATLIDRGGGLIYDDVLDITWLQDANYAQTSGYDSDGRMTWSRAVAWSSGLSYHDPIRDVIWDDWRLPNILPINGVRYDYGSSYDGSTDNGYNVSAPYSVYAGSTGSEMAYMYYNNLKNKAYFDVNGNPGQAGHSIHNISFESGGPGGIEVSFINLRFDQLGVWWSGTEYAPNPLYAWEFAFYRGGQADLRKEDFNLFAWAVRDGDVGPAPVPEPATMFLLGFGLIGLMGIRRKFKN